MKFWNGIAGVAAAGVLASCVQMGEPERWNEVDHRIDFFDRGVLAIEPATPERKAALAPFMNTKPGTQDRAEALKNGARPSLLDDRWCRHVAGLRDVADGASAWPTGAERVAVDEDRKTLIAEIQAQNPDDPYWPLRKGMICEYLLGAEEELRELDWVTTDQFLKAARAAERSKIAPQDVKPLIPIYAYDSGAEGVADLEVVDFSSTAFCADLGESSRALVQRVGPLRGEQGFIGAVLRTPDWLALTHVAYHRWAREQEEGHQTAPTDEDAGGIPFHCSRFHIGFEILKTYAVKDNLIFLLPEFDDPKKAGRLEITDAQGNTVILDRVLAAAQLDDGGRNSELIEFFREDIEATPSLKAAVENAENAERPKQYLVFFEFGETEPIDDPDRLRELGLDMTRSEPKKPINGIKALKDDLKDRNPESPLKILITAYADCFGRSGDNLRLSDRRADALQTDVIEPILKKIGFTDVDFANEGVSSFRREGRGEEPLAQGLRCAQLEDDDRAFARRASVLVQ